MKNFLIRASFLVGIGIFAVLVSLWFFLPPSQFSEFNQSPLANLMYLTSGITIVFMFGATLYATYHIIRQRNATILGWLPLIWLLPFLGTFLYLELKILRGNTELKSSNELDEGRLRPPMILHEDRRLLWRRVVAAAIDLAIFISLSGLYARYLGTPTDTGSYEVTGFEAFTLMLVTWMFVFPLPEFFFGATIGKLMTGIRVFMQSGAKPTLSSTLKRHVLDVVDIAIILGSIPLTGGRQEGPLRMGDRWAKTVVVKRPLKHSSSPIDAL